jgi:hypothetical protein
MLCFSCPYFPSCAIDGCQRGFQCSSMSVLVESSFFYFGWFCTSHVSYALSTLLSGNACWENGCLPEIVVDAFALFLGDNGLGFTLRACLILAERLLGFVIEDLWSRVWFFSCCVYSKRIIGKFMFMICWWRSGGGCYCQNRRGKRHIRRSHLECTSFARVGDVGKLTNSCTES